MCESKVVLVQYFMKLGYQYQSQVHESLFPDIVYLSHLIQSIIKTNNLYVYMFLADHQQVLSISQNVYTSNLNNVRIFNLPLQSWSSPPCLRFSDSVFCTSSERCSPEIVFQYITPQFRLKHLWLNTLIVNFIKFETDMGWIKKVTEITDTHRKVQHLIIVVNMYDKPS